LLPINSYVQPLANKRNFTHWCTVTSWIFNCRTISSKSSANVWDWTVIHNRNCNIIHKIHTQIENAIFFKNSNVPETRRISIIFGKSAKFLTKCISFPTLVLMKLHNSSIKAAPYCKKIYFAQHFLKNKQTWGFAGNYVCTLLVCITRKWHFKRRHIDRATTWNRVHSLHMYIWKTPKLVRQTKHLCIHHVPCTNMRSVMCKHWLWMKIFFSLVMKSYVDVAKDYIGLSLKLDILLETADWSELVKATHVTWHEICS
jgi:hypothetical protein